MCDNSEKNSHIFERYYRVWFMEPKRSILHFKSIHWCILGRKCWWPKQYQWSNILLGRLFGIMANQEKIIHFTIYSRSWIYCCFIMLHSSHLDETYIGILTCKVWASNSDKLWQYQCHKHIKKPCYALQDRSHPYKISIFVRDQVSQKVMKRKFVGTREHIVDIFTKPLLKEAFEHLRKKLGVISLQ